MKLTELYELGNSAKILSQLKQAKSYDVLTLQSQVSGSGFVAFQILLSREQTTTVVELLIAEAESALIAGGIEDAVPGVVSVTPSQKEVDTTKPAA